MIKAILACDDDWGIGKCGGLPWPHNPNDLKWFKENTIEGVVVMGKSTWDSLPFKPLPKRENIIVTSRDQIIGLSDYEFVKFPDIRQKLLGIKQSSDIWIIGGAKLINGLIDIIAEFHLSQIKGTYNCDTFLPEKLIKERYRLKESGKFGDGSFNIWCKK